MKKLERNFEKGVDFRRKCGIINKLSRKTAALQKPNKAMYQQKRSGEPESVRAEAFKKAFGRLKKISKKCLTKSTTFDIMIELSERRASRTLKIEQY